MKQQGFTLTEIMTTTAIMLTVGSMANTSFESTGYWLEPKNLFNAIQETRTFAITNNTHAALCPSEDGLICQTNWQLPLIMFVDSNNNKQRDIDEEIIHRFAPYSQLTRTISYPRSQIRFNGQGQTNGYIGTLSYCSEYNSKAIVISRVGRVRYSSEDKCS
jgi:type IV fimbrial biogenesis protein FimT